MSKALKWIPDKKDYIPYDLPDGACLYTDNMEQEIACCQCGKKVKFGDCYISRTIHTELGFGYAELPRVLFFVFQGANLWKKQSLIKKVLFSPKNS